MSLVINANDTVLYQGSTYTVSSVTITQVNVGGVFRDQYTIVPTSGANIVAYGFNIVLQDVAINSSQVWVVSK